MSTRVEAAINAAKAGDTKAATELLTQALKENPKNTRAWYLLSQVTSDNAEAQMYVKKVLEIAPDNQQAKDRLEKLIAEGERFEEIKIPTNADIAARNTVVLQNAVVSGFRTYVWGIIIMTIISVLCIMLVFAYLDS